MVGKPYQKAYRLSATATGNWQKIDGYYSGKGIDLLHLSFPRYLNVIYSWAMTNQTQEAAEKWEMELTSPLPGQKETDSYAQAELDQIKNM